VLRRRDRNAHKKKMRDEATKNRFDDNQKVQEENRRRFLEWF
jgi:hypothetical protein